MEPVRANQKSKLFRNLIRNHAELTGIDERIALKGISIKLSVEG